MLPDLVKDIWDPPAGGGVDSNAVLWEDGTPLLWEDLSDVDWEQ